MSRVQLALNVDNIDESIAFYSALFGVEPAKRRPGYANFAVPEPPLKLVLIENPGAAQRLNHLGIEASTPEQVSAALARFSAAGLATRVAEQDLCCHAAQDKVFVTAPDVPLGWWEWSTTPSPTTTRPTPRAPRRLCAS